MFIIVSHNLPVNLRVNVLCVMWYETTVTVEILKIEACKMITPVLETGIVDF